MGSEHQMQQFINNPATARLLFAHKSYKYSELVWHQPPRTHQAMATRPPHGIIYKGTWILPTPPPLAVGNLLSLSPSLRGINQVTCSLVFIR